MMPCSSPQEAALHMLAEPRWTAERIAFIREQYLTHRKSAGEIAHMLGPGFSRNAVTGKLYRIGALQARSGIGLGRSHGLPRVNNFCPGKKRPVQKPSKELTGKTKPHNSNAMPLPQLPPAMPIPNGHGDKAFVKRVEALFDISGIPLVEAGITHCRWPARPIESLAHVCGKARVNGSYCALHAVISYRSKPIRRSELISNE